MIEQLDGFVRELREVGLPISLSDKIDALRAISLVDMLQREELRDALTATLVKRAEHVGAFNAVFDIYFASSRVAPLEQPAISDHTATEAGGPLAEVSPDDLVALLRKAIAQQDTVMMRLLAREAVRRYSGFEPGRPVGGTYYVMRTLRQLDLTAILAALGEQTASDLQQGRIDPLGARLRNDQHEREAVNVRQEVESEVRRLVAEDRGSEALARTLRKPLPEDLEFVNASGADIDAMKQVLTPLTRRLAAHLARRRRRGRRGRLDFRRTIRRSMDHGGVPAELRFHPPKPVKPELVVVADISGSVASFARFTLQMLYALSSQFSKVRSFVFVDGLTEITDLLARADDVQDLVGLVNEQTSMLWVDGHSDYGHAFRTLLEGWGSEIGSRASVIVLGDARNNYHAAEADAFAALSRRVRHTFWLNPEPRGGWDSGDSIVSVYAPYCDQVLECRTLEQLRDFVESLA